MFRASLLLLFALVARAADDAPVALPPFMVHETSSGPPWLYARVLDYEILSHTSEASTRNVIDAYLKLHQVLDGVLPSALRLNLSLPKTLVFFERGQTIATPEIVEQLTRRESAGLLQDDNPMPFGRGKFLMPAPPRIVFTPNLRLTDIDAMALFSIVGPESLEADQLSLTLDYIHYLLQERVPALPPWFIEGFLEFFHEAKFGRGELTLPPTEWVSPAATAAWKKDPKTARGPMALPAFFAANLSEVRLSAVDPASLWRAQAELLVRWGLDAKDGAYREGLWKFVDRAAVEPVNESLFRECFGFGYTAAQEELKSYLSTAVRHGAKFRPKNPSPLPAYTVRRATETEIARIRGDLERLEVGYVKTVQPELAGKYLEQARRTLRHAYENDSRDPGLLAVLGLVEVDAGRGPEARVYLEAAAARSHDLRPRAWLELARLRFAEMRALLARSDGRLSKEQTAQLLSPLFAARKLEPALPEVYELIADVWSLSAVKPMRAHLAVIDEGVLIFPKRTELVYRDAELNTRYGYVEEARQLVALGLRFATDEATRARFTRLQAQLDGEAPRAP